MEKVATMETEALECWAKICGFSVAVHEGELGCRADIKGLDGGTFEGVAKARHGFTVEDTCRMAEEWIEEQHAAQRYQ